MFKEKGKINRFQLITALISISFAVALVNFCVDAIYFDGTTFIQGENFSIHQQPVYTYLQRRFFILIALLFGLFLFFLNKKLLLYLSAFSLLLVQLAYCHWLWGTYQGTVNAEDYGYDKLRHLAFLSNANYADVFVWFAAFLALLLVIFFVSKSRRTQLL